LHERSGAANEEGRGLNHACDIGILNIKGELRGDEGKKKGMGHKPARKKRSMTSLET